MSDRRGKQRAAVKAGEAAARLAGRSGGRPAMPGAEENHLRLFVYGTLKRGFSNHDRFCRRAAGIEPAAAWGRLHHLPDGFPAMEVPESRILAHGTADPAADARTQNAIEPPETAMDRPEGDWDLVHGEMATFADPGLDLPPIDRLEDFNPGGPGMYRRVLVAVEARGRRYTCWTYQGLDHILRGGLRLIGGHWPPAG